MSEDNGIFAKCETVSEIILVTSHLTAMEGVKRPFTSSGDLTREALQRAVVNLARVGLSELASWSGSTRGGYRGQSTFDRRGQTDLRGEAAQLGVRGLKGLMKMHVKCDRTTQG